MTIIKVVIEMLEVGINKSLIFCKNKNNKSNLKTTTIKSGQEDVELDCKIVQKYF